MTILAVFRSRAETMDFSSRLRNRGISVSVVNTPKQANVGCGLSAKFESNFLMQAKYIVSSRSYTAFVGFYRLNDRYGNAIISLLR